MKLFREIAEELSQYELVGRLQAMISNLSTISLRESSSIGWAEYYSIRLEFLKGNRDFAEKQYRQLLNGVDDPRLEAYLLCDLGGSLLDLNSTHIDNDEGKRYLLSFGHEFGHLKKSRGFPLSLELRR